MVNIKKNLLVVAPEVPQPDLSAGDYRVWHLTNELSKHFNVFFMPLKRNDGKNRNCKFKTSVKKIINPAVSKNNFLAVIKRNNIDFCLFEKYWNMSFDTEKLISVCPNSVIDVHEIGYIKTAALSKIQNIKHQKLYKAKELLFYKNADLLITISQKEKTELKKIFPDKQIIVVPTCVKISRNARFNFSERKNICYFGFYNHIPNIDAVNYFAKNIFPGLKQKSSDIEFHVLGNGSAMFKNKYKDIKVKDHIKNIPKELSKYKVFVCPLRYGAGIKKKVLDAMNAKTPVVSTSYGFEGIKKLEQKSLSFENGNFVSQIVKIYSNKTIWNKISRTNFNTVKNYYSEKSFSRYVAICVEKMKRLI